MISEKQQRYESARQASSQDDLSADELQAACGRSIAFVLAIDGGSQSEIKQALETARRSHVAGVFVFASEAYASAAVEAVRLVGRSGRTLVQAIEFDTAASLELTRKAGDFELFGLPYGLLESMRAVSESVLDEYESVLVLKAAQTKVAKRHLYELCCDIRSHPDLDALASCAERCADSDGIGAALQQSASDRDQPGVRRFAFDANTSDSRQVAIDESGSAGRRLRCAPFLVQRSFLERLKDMPAATGMSGGQLSSTRLKAADHVFDGEQLAVATPRPPLVEAFFRDGTMSALQAIHLAQYARRHPTEELHSPNHLQSGGQAASPEPLNAADKWLVQGATRVLERAHCVADGASPLDLGQLATYAQRSLEGAGGVAVVNVGGLATEENGRIVAFTVRSVAPDALAYFLARLDVALFREVDDVSQVPASTGLLGVGSLAIGEQTSCDEIDAAVLAIDLCRRLYEA